ncbi:MAG: hypothetical protein ABI972_23265 [Acidobacteriota bacterium]
MANKKVPITHRALIQRINRKLAQDGMILKTARLYSTGHENTNLGRYYIVDRTKNTLAFSHCDLDYWGKRVGVLAEWEKLLDEQ